MWQQCQVRWKRERLSPALVFPATACAWRMNTLLKGAQSGNRVTAVVQMIGSRHISRQYIGLSGMCVLFRHLSMACLRGLWGACRTLMGTSSLWDAHWILYCPRSDSFLFWPFAGVPWVSHHVPDHEAGSSRSERHSRRAEDLVNAHGERPQRIWTWDWITVDCCQQNQYSINPRQLERSCLWQSIAIVMRRVWATDPYSTATVLFEEMFTGAAFDHISGSFALQSSVSKTRSL